MNEEAAEIRESVDATTSVEAVVETVAAAESAPRADTAAEIMSVMVARVRTILDKLPGILKERHWQ